MNAIEMRGISKFFGDFCALNNVDFAVEEGEIHSLLGENGAGKSTLMNILYGILQPNEGEIYINGNKEVIRNSAEAIRLGIGMVHQHFMLTPVMSVAENIIVGSEPVKGPFINYKQAKKEVSELIEKFHFGIDADAKVQTLSVGEQQRIEILKAIYKRANILILDEPTAVLTPQEVDALFVVLRQLKEAGKSIVIITHKLKETIAIADRVTVLRSGQIITSGKPKDECNMNDLALMMVGRKVDLDLTRRTDTVGETAFEAKNICLSKNGVQILKNINIKLNKNEIFGIAGIEGNGQSELIEVLTGLRECDSGEFYLHGEKFSGNANDFLRADIGHIPEDRLTRGLVGQMSVADNLVLGYHTGEQFSRKGIRKLKAIDSFSKEKTAEFDIKVPNTDSNCGKLSGGNQQKVVIARVFSENPDVIIVAQPTRGVDIGAQEFIHNRLLDLRDEGKAILLISADLDEVKHLSDRLAVIYNGEIVAEEKADVWDEMELGIMMAGGKEKDEE